MNTSMPASLPIRQDQLIISPFHDRSRARDCQANSARRAPHPERALRTGVRSAIIAIPGLNGQDGERSRHVWDAGPEFDGVAVTLAARDAHEPSSLLGNRLEHAATFEAAVRQPT